MLSKPETPTRTSRALRVVIYGGQLILIAVFCMSPRWFLSDPVAKRAEGGAAAPREKAPPQQTLENDTKRSKPTWLTQLGPALDALRRNGCTILVYGDGKIAVTTVRAVGSPLGLASRNSRPIQWCGTQMTDYDRIVEFLEPIGKKTFRDNAIAELAKLPKLVDLELTGSVLTERAVDALSQLKGLKFLDILGTKLTEKDAHALISELPGCYIRWLPDCVKLVDIETAMHWGAELRVFERGVTAIRFRSAERRMSTRADGDVWRARESLLESFGKVTSYFYSGPHLSNPGPIDDHGLSALRAFPRLVFLDLSGSWVSDVGLEQLSQHSELEYINLSNTWVSSQGVAELKRNLPNLKVVNEVIDEPWQDRDEINGIFTVLSGPNPIPAIREHGGTFIRVPPNDRSNIRASGTGVIFESTPGVTPKRIRTYARVGDYFGGLAHYVPTDYKLAGDEMVAQVVNLHELRILKLTGSGFTDACVADLKKLWDLQLLELSGTSLSPAGIHEVQSYLTGLRIDAD